MKWKIALLASIVIGALIGCATSDRLNDVRIGMTKDQVTALLGKPDSMSAQGGIQYFTYDLNSPNGRNVPYLIRFVGDKVESFGRLTQLNDMYIRPVTADGQPGTLNLPPALLGGAAMVATTPSALPAPDLVTEIKQLKELKDQGVLSEDEFQRAEEKVLSPQK
jgi:hypothetical protein